MSRVRSRNQTMCRLDAVGEVWSAARSLIRSGLRQRLDVLGESPRQSSLTAVARALEQIL